MEALPNDIIEKLKKLFNKGKYNVLEKEIADLLIKFPDNVFLWNIQAINETSLKNYTGAIKSFLKCLDIKKKNKDTEAIDQLYSNIAFAYVNLNDNKKALKNFKLSLRFNDSSLRNLLSVSDIYFTEKKYDDSILYLKKASVLDENNFKIVYQIGKILMLKGENEEALNFLIKTDKIEPDNNDVKRSMARCYTSLGNVEEAEKIYSDIIKIDKRNYFVHNDLGSLYVKMDKERAVDINNPNLKIRELKDLAILSFKKAIEINPDYADAYNNLALMQQSNDFEAALNNFHKAVKLNPEFAEAYNNLGLLNKNLGNIDEARKSFEQAINLKPNYYDAHLYLTSIQKYNGNEEQVKQLLEFNDNKNLNDNDQIKINFSLGKIFEDINEFDQSFSYYKKGNDIKRKQVSYSLDNDRKLFSFIKDKFHGSNENDLSIDVSKKGIIKKPVFIVGMPRSGTTLVEQILSSHSHIFGAGELHFLQTLISINKILSSDITIEKIEILRNSYIEKICDFGNSEEYITDKMPFNFLFIGFILKAFPEAKIIHTRRDAMAICWSNYKTNFPGEQLHFTNGLDELAEYYKLYSDIMNFWHERFPNNIYDLDYEKLVVDQEKETRDLINYMELDWEDACLESEKNKRIVKTASNIQVRQKIYQKSSLQWQNFENHLVGLSKNLKDF